MTLPRVRYANTDDGIRVAFTATGEGPPLVYLQPHSHVLREWQLPEMRDWYTRLARRRRIIRLDIRHFGLSQRDAGPITLESCVADLRAVVEGAGLTRFDLVGIGGLAPPAAAFAERHPERVRALILWAPAPEGGRGGRAATRASGALAP